MLRGDLARAETITLLPEGGAHLVINLGEGGRSERFGQAFAGEGAHLVGAMLYADRQVLAGEQHLVGVTYRPGAFTSFHSFEAMTSATDRVRRVACPLSLDTVRAVGDLNQLAPYLDRVHLERLAPARAGLAALIADVAARRGRVRIDELLRRHALTGRSLERQFARLVGLTPKAFIDLTRFKHALVDLEIHGGRRTLDRIARDCGYYDGAHMTNAFKRYTGEPPSRFILSPLSKAASVGVDTVDPE
jgi:AraC-like DNA-binding protein